MIKIILKSLVGSKAHGLDAPESDTDIRGIFSLPTSEILSLGYKEKSTDWVEGEKIDSTSYEIRHFLNLAMHSNPSILEVLRGPIVETTEWGQELKSLFPCLWTSKNVLDAFRGYSLNQRKKFIEDKERPNKFAVAYLRVLLLGIELLRNGTMTVNVAEQEALPCMDGATIRSIPSTIFKAGSWDVPTNASVLMGVKRGVYSKGSIIDLAVYLEEILVGAYNANPNHVNDQDQINAFLLKVRKANWD